MAVVPMSHAARAQPFLWVLQNAGVDVERRLARERLPSNLLYEADLVIPVRSVFQFVEKTALREGIDDIAMRGAMEDGVQNLEPWVKNFLFGATTLNQLLERFCCAAKHYTPYRKYTIEQDEDLVRLCSRADAGLHGEAFLRLSDWSNVCLMLKIMRRVLGQHFTPHAIMFQTSANWTDAQRATLHGIPVFQGCTTACVEFPKELLATPIPAALQAGNCQELPWEAMDPLSFTGQMRELLKPCLSESWLDVEAVAEMVGCSIRTLQRRLSATSLTFSQLHDQARMEVAKTLLDQQDARITEVGLEVGYSDPANFTRAFRRINGVTPSQYRRRTLDEQSDRLHA